MANGKLLTLSAVALLGREFRSTVYREGVCCNDLPLTQRLFSELGGERGLRGSLFRHTPLGVGGWLLV